MLKATTDLYNFFHLFFLCFTKITVLQWLDPLVVTNRIEGMSVGCQIIAKKTEQNNFAPFTPEAALKK
jgi:hypothetical protein